jgi:hypothetical protein
MPVQDIIFSTSCNIDNLNLLFFCGVILELYREVLVTLGGGSCVSCQDQGYDSCVQPCLQQRCACVLSLYNVAIRCIVAYELTLRVSEQMFIQLIPNRVKFYYYRL